jgi:CRP-like cAMP-binding protein
VEGEPGDRYLVLVGGEAVVVQGGREVGRVGPGDGIGEIALLRRVPRTATVTALDEVSTLELGGDAFLAAVTGHAASGTRADALVDAHLASDATRRDADSS